MEESGKQLEGQNVEYSIANEVFVPIYRDIYFAEKLMTFGDRELGSVRARSQSRVRGLNNFIKSLLIKINYIYPIIEQKKTAEWNWKFRSDNQKKENPFNIWCKDINELNKYDTYLISGQRAIEKAESTESLKDDFVSYKDGDKNSDQVFVNERFWGFYERVKIVSRKIENIIITNGLRMYKKDENRAEETVMEMTDERLAFS